MNIPNFANENKDYFIQKTSPNYYSNNIYDNKYHDTTLLFYYMLLTQIIRAKSKLIF